MLVNHMHDKSSLLKWNGVAVLKNKLCLPQEGLQISSQYHKQENINKRTGTVVWAETTAKVVGKSGNRRCSMRGRGTDQSAPSTPAKEALVPPFIQDNFPYEPY